MKVTISIPGIDEFDAEFIDEFHLNQFRKHYTLIGNGAVMINGINLRPRITIEDILNSVKKSNSLIDS